MGITLTQLLGDLEGTCALLEGELFGVHVDRSRLQASGSAVMDFTFDPPPEFAARGFGTERGRITARVDGRLHTFPLGSTGRRWKHRNPSPLGPEFDWLAGDLCLWYPQDPRGLRWEWDDGFEQYVTRVHRHLFFEEYWRRMDEWPVEDAPHGEPPTGAHPVRTRQMREAAKQWA
jgi:hypothetical protein